MLTKLKSNLAQYVSVSWFFYVLLLAIRVFVGPLLPGYIHPDEFFQGGQELWFGCPPTIPWEFEPENALRSVFPPTIMTWIPLKVYSVLTQQPTEMLSGKEVLIIPRVACAILSIITIDRSVWSIVKSKNDSEVPIEVLLLASAWPVLVMLSRPFSNTLETCILSLLLETILQNREDVGWRKCSKIATLCALGLFTRFTFVFFAFPAVLHFLHVSSWHHDNRIQILASKFVILGIVFLLVAAVIVYSDTAFYIGEANKQNQSIQDTKITLTPWNALSYNSKISNLKDHGLHPRWTHAVVNMFILFGPMTLASYTNIIYSQERISNISSSPVHTICRLVLFFGLGFLSLAPHQEPRFLLPLTIPVVFLSAWCFRLKVIWGLWMAFNVILYSLFGILHQAGVVYSLGAVGGAALSELDSPLLIYFHTYMPPTFLSRSTKRVACLSDDSLGSVSTQTCAAADYLSPAENKNACTNIRVIDLNGSNFEKLQEILDSKLHCSDDDDDDNDKSDDENASVFVASPPLSHTNSNGQLWRLYDDCVLPNNYSCRKQHHFTPHLTTEDFPPYPGSLPELYHYMNVAIYEISCTNQRARI